MFDNFVSALFQAFFPLALISAILAYWFLRKQPNNHTTSTRDFKVQLKTLKKSEKQLSKDQYHRSELNIVQKKWLKFGGNFYGVVALYTYFLVEIADIVKFFRTFTNIEDFIARIDLSMIINQLLQALMNFITAITWPIYWLDSAQGDNGIVIWLLMAYLGYLAGLKAAMLYRRHQRSLTEQ